MRRPTTNLLLCLLLLTGCRTVREERFLANTRINDKPVRFAYDTGAEGTVLFTWPAKRLGLNVFRPRPFQNVPPGEVTIGHTEFCRFNVDGETYTLRLETLRLPMLAGAMFDVDGLIGWPDIEENIVRIDAVNDTIQAMNKLPADINGWLKLPVYHSGMLALEIPRSDGKKGVLEVDTGNPGGLSLSDERWKEWRAAHPQVHGKKEIGFMPGSGMGVHRIYKADTVSIGPLTWTNLPVHTANVTEDSAALAGDVFEGSIGITALKQFDVIVDKKNHTAYLKRRTGITATNAPNVGSIAGNPLHFRFRKHEIIDRATEARDTGNLPKALAELNRLVDLDPKNEWALYQRGAIHFRLQHWHDAASDFHRFCELEPDRAYYPQFYLWMIAAGGGHQAAANEALAKYMEQDGKSNGSPWEKIIGAFLLDRLPEKDFFRTSITRKSGDITAQQCEAWFYAGVKRRLSGDIDTARKYFQKCIATWRTDEDEYHFAATELNLLK